MEGLSLCNAKRLAIRTVLKVVSLVVFASTLFSRAVDPVVPKIAADLGIDVKTAARGEGGCRGPMKRPS